MKVIFTFKEKQYTYEIKNNIIKIYQVPQEYSEDELYIADYTSTSLEPYPSSDCKKTKLLYHGNYRKMMSTSYMEEVYNILEEITYA